METPIALHSVAHRVSHQIPAESEMSRQNRAAPPQIKVSHLSPDPPVALSSVQQAGGSENGSRYRGVSQLQSHQSRYSVQLRWSEGGIIAPSEDLGRIPRRFWGFRALHLSNQAEGKRKMVPRYKLKPTVHRFLAASATSGACKIEGVNFQFGD